MNIKILQLPHANGMPLPSRATAHSAGMDLMAAIPKGQPLVLLPGDRCLVPTGLVIAIPAGFEGQIRPRSGMALKHGVTVLNSPGTIDADYRNEVMVILINHGNASIKIKRGDRIAQLVMASVSESSWTIVANASELGATERGQGGLGSTGV
jgi:dUTP pyrophosphatase